MSQRVARAADAGGGAVAHRGHGRCVGRSSFDRAIGRYLSDATGAVGAAWPGSAGSFLVAGAGLPATAVVLGSNGRIAFASDRDGDFEIYSIEPEGTGLLQLTTNAVDDDDPSWSPDGTPHRVRAHGLVRDRVQGDLGDGRRRHRADRRHGVVERHRRHRAHVGVGVDAAVHQQPGERRWSAAEGDLVDPGHRRHGDAADRDDWRELRAGRRRPTAPRWSSPPTATARAVCTR